MIIGKAYHSLAVAAAPVTRLNMAAAYHCGGRLEAGGVASSGGGGTGGGSGSYIVFVPTQLAFVDNASLCTGTDVR